MEDVEELVDGVLAAVPALLREACDRDGILSGLAQADLWIRNLKYLDL